MLDEKVKYDLDSFPDDAEVYTQPPKYDPLDDAEMYQVMVQKIELRDNPFYKPNEEDPQKRGVKYNLSFEFVVLDDGDFKGRKLWDNTTLAFKPDGKRGPTKLYKLVTAALKTMFTWEQCAEWAPDAKTLGSKLATEVVGKQVRVAIANSTNPDTKKVRTKILSYSSVKKELETPTPTAEGDIPF